MLKRWRHSLFVKIFIWFWLVIFSSVAMVFVTMEILHEKSERVATLKERKIFYHLLKNGEAKEFDYKVFKRRLPHRWRLYSIQPNIKKYSHFLEELHEEIEEFDGELIYFEFHRMAVIAGKEINGRMYVAIKKAHWRGALGDGREWLVGFILLSVITLFSALLGWYLSRPITQLQKATRQLAKGDFSLEMLRKQKRYDEVGLLAQDFVAMADDLEKLLASHQQLLRDVSHELRSPLTRLRIALGIAQKKDETNGSLLDREHEKISRAVNQVEYLISNILDLAKLQQNQLLDCEQLDAGAAISEWIEDAEPEITAKQLTLDVQLQESVKVCWDKALMQRAFDNVLRNAIRFAPESSQLTISLELQQSDRNQLIWTIKDQGPGVDPDNLESIFDAFVQEDESRGHEQPSYGLGLALVKRIVELHMGNVVAENLAADASGAQSGFAVAVSLPTP